MEAEGRETKTVTLHWRWMLTVRTDGESEPGFQAFNTTFIFFWPVLFSVVEMEDVNM